MIILVPETLPPMHFSVSLAVHNTKAIIIVVGGKIKGNACMNVDAVFKRTCKTTASRVISQDH